MDRLRSCCFTLNNYTEQDYEELRNMNSSYIVIGKEVGEQGTPHLQGYVEFKNQVRFSTLKKRYPKLHIEARRGTPLQASTYCKKEGDYVEIGNINEQGKRNDILSSCELILEKKSMKEVANHNPEVFVKYHKGLIAFKNIQYEDRTAKPQVHWRWGPAGCGKTRYCVEKHPDHYIKDGTMWWDSYEQQEAIIIDDFDGHWPYRDLLRLLDRNKYQGQYKGGYVKINSPYIYITCEFPPEHFWLGNTLAQVMRRIDSVSNVSEVAGNTNSNSFETK